MHTTYHNSNIVTKAVIKPPRRVKSPHYYSQQEEVEVEVEVAREEAVS